jgi:t-SNARE complex subunit (syntaxin)
MPVREREHGELPSPICPGSTARSGRDLLFSEIIVILIVVVVVVLVLTPQKLQNFGLS